MAAQCTVNEQYIFMYIYHNTTSILEMLASQVWFDFTHRMQYSCTGQLQHLWTPNDANPEYYQRKYIRVFDDAILYIRLPCWIISPSQCAKEQTTCTNFSESFLLNF